MQQVSDWKTQAEVFLVKKFLPRTRGQAFLIEQFRRSAEKAGVAMPADLHDFGGFVRAMRCRGYVRRSGFALDSYGSPKSLWRSL